MKEISERAFVFAKRMYARGESESSIRSVLSEFDLSENEVAFVLKEAEHGTPFRFLPSSASTQSNALLEERIQSYPAQAKSKRVNPLSRAKNDIRDYILGLLIYGLLLMLMFLW